MSADRLVRVRRTGALAFVTVLTACSWFTDFKDQPKYDPWKSVSDTVAMRANPQNSVPVYGTFAPGYAVSRIPRLTMTVGYDGRFSHGDYGIWVPAGPDRMAAASDLLRKHGALEVRNER